MGTRDRLGRPWLAVVVAASTAFAPLAVAQARVCTTGKPCGDTCIAANETCHVGGGSARRAEEGDATVAIAVIVTLLVLGGLGLWWGLSRMPTSGEQDGYTEPAPERAEPEAGTVRTETGAAPAGPAAGAAALDRFLRSRWRDPSRPDANRVTLAHGPSCPGLMLIGWPARGDAVAFGGPAVAYVVGVEANGLLPVQLADGRLGSVYAGCAVW